MKVKNFRSGDAVSSPTCSCSSWIDHWNKNKYLNNEKVAGYCRFCNKKFDPKDLVGGHVIKTSGDDKSRYIIPLCYSCNSPNNDSIYEVDTNDLILSSKNSCKA